MFTGIVEEIGKVIEMKGDSKGIDIKIACSRVLEDTILGDSICVNGICLTVTEMSDSYFVAQMMRETLEKTAMGRLKKGSRVNLERALTLQKRLGGHIVSGHVDDVGSISNIRKEGISNVYSIKVAGENEKYLIYKGSITINGTSLTVSSVGDGYFEVSIIPHTSDQTVISELKPGDTVNLEFDIIGKYVERLLRMEKKSEKSNMDMNFLERNGFL